MTAATFTGPLAADAEARRTTDGNAQLQITLDLPAGAKGTPMKVRATKTYGTGAAADIACKHRARELRRGVRVTVSGSTCTWLRGVALLGGVADVHTPDLIRRDYTQTDPQ